MLGKLGMPELLIIFAVALLIFGPRKIGELGKGLGDGIRSFKSAIKEKDDARILDSTSEHTQARSICDV